MALAASRASPLLIAALSLALASCSLTRKQPDEPRALPSGSNVPQPPPDVLAIPDAVPRIEPRGTRGNPPFYEVFGKRYYVLANSEGHVERGIASWYGPGFHAASTSLGEPYDMYAMTAAHKTLPIPCYAEVTNTQNGRRVVVRINDRGPFVGDRIIDLSYTAAAKLDMLRAGTAPVEIRIITPRGGGTTMAGSALPVQTPAAPPPRPAVTVVNAPAGPAPMFIAAGVFADHENARRRVETLLAAGIELASLDELPRSTRALHRVRVGPIGSVEEFDRLMAKLRELGIPDARLLTE
jgi:rare lipoprotein A